MNNNIQRTPLSMQNQSPQRSKMPELNPLLQPQNNVILAASAYIILQLHDHDDVLVSTRSLPCSVHGRVNTWFLAQCFLLFCISTQDCFTLPYPSPFLSQNSSFLFGWVMVFTNTLSAVADTTLHHCQMLMGVIRAGSVSL